MSHQQFNIILTSSFIDFGVLIKFSFYVGGNDYISLIVFSFGLFKFCDDCR